jgi:hypothetical protein
MIFQRKEAVHLASFVQMFQLSSKVRERKTESAICEAGIEKPTESGKSFYLRKYLEVELKKVKNSYLENLLTNTYDCEIKVEGKEPNLFLCQCCNYITLEKRGEYFICPVCFWEDDGISSVNQFSSANKMTLGEGRYNFELLGAIKEDFLKFLYEDRMLRYDRKIDY